MNNPYTIASRSFAALYPPYLVAEYHPVLNSLPPDQVDPNCDDLVWWLCSNETCGNEWTATPILRSWELTCPRCDSPQWTCAELGVTPEYRAQREGKP